MSFSTSMLSKSWTRAVVYFFLLAGICIGPLTHWKHVRDVTRAQSFIEVEGVVVASELEYDYDDRYRPSIRVAYEVEGQRQWTKVIPALGIEDATGLTADELVERYPVGTPIPVWVNPEDASDAMLTRSYEDNSLLGGTAVLLVVLGFVIWGDRKRVLAERTS